MRQVASGTPYAALWDLGNSRSIKSGDRVFLLRQSQDRGFLGGGYARSGTIEETHWELTRSDQAADVDAFLEDLVLPTDRDDDASRATVNGSL